MSTLGGVQYSGGYHEYSGGYHKYIGGYHESTGGCSLHWAYKFNCFLNDLPQHLS